MRQKKAEFTRTEIYLLLFSAACWGFIVGSLVWNR